MKKGALPDGRRDEPSTGDASGTGTAAGDASSSGDASSTGNASGDASGTGDASTATPGFRNADSEIGRVQNRNKGGRPKGSLGKNKRIAAKRSSGSTFKPTAASEAKTTAKIPTNIASVEALLITLHWGIAQLSKIPEFHLDPTEAKSLAIATQAVIDQYDIQVAAKTLAWANLITTGATIYGTRAMAFHMRTSTERAVKAAKPGPVPINLQPQTQNG